MSDADDAKAGGERIAHALGGGMWCAECGAADTPLHKPECPVFRLEALCDLCGEGLEQTCLSGRKQKGCDRCTNNARAYYKRGVAFGP